MKAADSKFGYFFLRIFPVSLLIRKRSGVGVYRLWRDAGDAVGALAAGLLADAFGGSTAIGAIGALTQAVQHTILTYPSSLLHNHPL